MTKIQPINGPVDTAIRVVANLAAAGSSGLSIDRLRFFDLFSVHAADIDGPTGIHPRIAGRLRAYAFRWGHVEKALDLLKELGVVEKVGENHVLLVAASALPRAPYLDAVTEAARWLVCESDRVGEAVLDERMKAAIAEQTSTILPAFDRSFPLLAASYRSDLLRLDGIVCLADWLSHLPSCSLKTAENLKEISDAAVSELRNTRSLLRDLETMIAEQEKAESVLRDEFASALGLGPARANEIFDSLRAVYGASDRHYHDFEHVSSMLSDLRQLSLPAEWPVADMILAIFWHDVVYDPKASDNEVASAFRFERDVPELPADRRERVSRMIKATDHRRDPEDEPTALVVDLDLAVFADDLKYDDYVANVRHEYAFVSTEDWVRGRAGVLEGFLARPSIYRTTFLADREVVARRNLERELKDLK